MRPVDTLVKILRDGRAATTVEYGLIIALIIIVMVVALNNVATSTQTMWNNVASKVSAS